VLICSLPPGFARRRECLGWRQPAARLVRSAVTKLRWLSCRRIGMSKKVAARGAKEDHAHVPACKHRGSLL
jgi:hypothetical protein